MNRRWLRVGLIVSATFVVNVIARVVTEVADVTDEHALDLIAYTGLGAVFVLLVGAGAWWAVRHPFTRLFFDLGAAVLGFVLLSLLVGPLLVGASPFAGGPSFFVGQFLLQGGVGLAGVLLGFAAMVTVGKDWKSRGLRRYEESYKRRPNRAVRG